MKKDFDFDEIGKKTPYRIPEGFFEEMQSNVQKRVLPDNHRKKHRLWIAATAVAATLVGCMFLLFQEQSRQQNIQDMSDIEAYATTPASDRWILEISDEELEELVSFSDYDLFLN